MKKLSRSKKNFKIVSIVAGVVIVTSASFLVASGQVGGGASSLFASVFSSFSQKPSIVFLKDASSPNGTVTTGGVRTLGVFNVYSKNVSSWATLQNLTIDVVLSGGSNSASSLKLSQFALSYHYCIPSGVTYGYGFKGGSCATVTLPVSSATRNGDTYRVVSYGHTPIYPQASGQISVSAYMAYGVGGSAHDTAKVRVNIASATSIGDQCRAYGYISATHSYGYSQCVPLQSVVYTASGNNLSVQRSYGYGFCLL